MDFLVFALALGLTGQAERTLADQIVATVNDDVVTLSELRTAAQAVLSPGSDASERRRVFDTTLDNLIADRLISQQIDEAKIAVTEADVDRAIADILRQNNMTEMDLQGAIDSRGMTMRAYRRDLEAQIVRLKLIDLKVRSRVSIPESEIRAEYEARTSQEEREELLSLSHIFFRWGESQTDAEKKRVKDRAEGVRQQLLDGADFATLAKSVSEGPTASSGGSLGEIARSGLLPELKRAVANLKADSMSGLVETPNGIHIVRVDGIRVQAADDYDKVRNQIYQRLYQVEVERQMQSWLRELRQRGAVKLRLDGVEL